MLFFCSQYLMKRSLQEKEVSWNHQMKWWLLIFLMPWFLGFTLTIGIALIAVIIVLSVSILLILNIFCPYMCYYRRKLKKSSHSSLTVLANTDTYGYNLSPQENLSPPTVQGNPSPPAVRENNLHTLKQSLIDLVESTDQENTATTV